MDRLKVTACAKINLSLSVIGKRNDGYHELDTVMQSVDLSDTVYIEKSAKTSVSGGSFLQEESIEYKAARLFSETVGTGGACIKTEKNIPVAAGLGGGSADAAAVLTGMNELYGTGLTKEELCNMAVKLGADVPFLIYGGTARARGIGEKLTLLRPITKCYFVIIKAGGKLSTAEMFSRLDNTDYKKPDIEKTVQALENSDTDMLLSSLSNSFEILWQDSAVLKTVNELGADAVALSGSGPARFAVFREMLAAEKACKILKENGIEAYACRPTEKSLIIE